ncbi:MAG: hypothetical protein AAGH76_16520 [Pseudomonadota bacterium]
MPDIDTLQHRYRKASAPDDIHAAIQRELADGATARARWPWFAVGFSAALALVVIVPLLKSPPPSGVPSMLEVARSLPNRPIGSVPSISRVGMPTQPRLPTRPSTPPENDNAAPLTPADNSGTTALPRPNTKEKTA